MSAPTADLVDVAVVRWPAQESIRRRLAGLRRPRLLLVAIDARPPELVDELEDWLREPVLPVDLAARVRTLRRRAAEHMGRPALDGDGLLRVGESWVAVTDAQLGIVELLLASFGALVMTDQLIDAYVTAGGVCDVSTIHTVLARLAVRLDEVGLALTSVRARGVALGYRPFGE